MDYSNEKLKFLFDWGRNQYRCTSWRSGMFLFSVFVDLSGHYQPTNPLASTRNICLKNATILCMKFSAAFLGPESHMI